MRQLPILAFLLAIPAAGCAQTAPPAISAAVTPLVQRERFTVQVVGEGTDVILIPGLSTPREVWRVTAERLKATHRLHLVQLRGFGDAAGPNAQGPVLQPFVDDLAGYIRDAKLDRPTVVGHSMGWLAALMLASEQPALAGRLVIVDSLPFIGTLFSPDATVASIRPQAEGMRAMMLAASRKEDGGPAPADGEAAAANTMSATPEGRAQVARWSFAADPAVVAQAMYDDMVTDVRPGLARIRVPVTVLYPLYGRGQEGPDGPYRSGYAGLDGAVLRQIPDTRHFIMLDQPAAFAQALDEALAED